MNGFSRAIYSGLPTVELARGANYGAISTAFSGLPERYLTASIVRFNVSQASSFPIDARTIDASSSERSRASSRPTL